MRYQVTKMDKRYANYGSFRYMLEFSKSSWVGTGVLEFDRARRWMNQTWGWTQDVQTRRDLITRKAYPTNIEIQEEDINRHWSYSVEYKEYRIYLKGDKELAFFNQFMHRVTVKKNLIVFHNLGEWSDIYANILRDFGMGMAVRTRMKRELGFTYRHHQGLVPNEHKTKNGPSMHYEQQVHVDFFGEAAQSWFQLKYLNRPTTNTEVVS